MRGLRPEAERAPHFVEARRYVAAVLALVVGDEIQEAGLLAGHEPVNYDIRNSIASNRFAIYVNAAAKNAGNFAE